MTKDELKEKRELLKKEYKTKENELLKEFAISNCNIRVGDLITDHYHTIRVDNMRIGFGGFSEYPEIVFNGTACKKDGKPLKRQNNDPVYQSNIKTVNGKEYKYILD